MAHDEYGHVGLQRDDPYDEPMRARPKTRTYAGKRSGPELLRRRADALYEEARRLQDELEATEARYAQYGPEPDQDGTVVRFDRQHSGRTYTYAALRKHGRWYLTQSGRRPVGMPAQTWHGLIDYADGARIEVVTGWTELLGG